MISASRTHPWPLPPSSLTSMMQQPLSRALFLTRSSQHAPAQLPCRSVWKAEVLTLTSGPSWSPCLSALCSPSRGSLLFPQHRLWSSLGPLHMLFPLPRTFFPWVCQDSVPHFRILFKCHAIREIFCGHLYRALPSPPPACPRPIIYSSLPHLLPFDTLYICWLFIISLLTSRKTPRRWVFCFVQCYIFRQLVGAQ